MSYSNYPNMSYCAIENTNAALGQIMGMMEEHDTIQEFIESRSADEQRAWRSLAVKLDSIQMMLDDEDMA